MYARVTQFTVNPIHIDLDIAQGVFERLVVPEMRKQPGYEGCYLLRTPEGRGQIIALWESEEAAISSEKSGFYAEQVEHLLPLLGGGELAPDREYYAVSFADHPVE